MSCFMERERGKSVERIFSFSSNSSSKVYHIICNSFKADLFRCVPTCYQCQVKKRNRQAHSIWVYFMSLVCVWISLFAGDTQKRKDRAQGVHKKNCSRIHSGCIFIWKLLQFSVRQTTKSYYLKKQTNKPKQNVTPQTKKSKMRGERMHVWGFQTQHAARSEAAAAPWPHGQLEWRLGLSLP